MKGFFDRDKEAYPRFESKFIPEPNSGCWIWLNATVSQGRGSFRLKAPRRNVLASRYSFFVHSGQIPTGMEVCHSCDNPSCVNPDHLFLGSHAVNMADMAAKNRANGGAPRGAKHGRTKLTDEDVRAIRDDPRPGRAIARDYGMSKSAIYYIKSRETWR